MKELNELEEEFDPRQFAKEVASYFESLQYDDNLPIGRNLINAFSDVCYLQHQYEYELFAAYAGLPSMMCSILPVCAVSGVSGSGKSELLVAATKILGVTLTSGTSTAASVKNIINASRWADPTTQNHEKNYHLIIDNLNKGAFDNNELLGPFLNGYNKQTDCQYISNGNGENIVFKVFGPKIISTVWKLAAYPELSRRLINIRSVKNLEIDTVSAVERDFSALSERLKTVWAEKKYCHKFIENRVHCHKVRKPSHAKDKWQLVNDVMASGVTLGVWDVPGDAVRSLCDYFDREKVFASKKGLLASTIQDVLVKATSAPIEDWPELQSKGVRLECASHDIRSAIRTVVEDGFLPKPLNEDIIQIIKDLGWGLCKSKAGGLTYRYKGVSDGD